MFAKHTILGEISKCLIDDFQFMEREQPVLLVHMVPYLYKTVSIFLFYQLSFTKYWQQLFVFVIKIVPK